MSQSPNSRNFRKYGKIIEYPNKGSKGTVRNLWRIVHTEPGQIGWRVAYLVLRDKTIGRMECHPESDETFEPIKGRAYIFVSQDKSLKNIECFLLDKPLIIFKGVWHGLVSLTPETEIKVFENSQVSCCYWKLDSRISRISDLTDVR
jgi:ureidoglycolate hydrolase